MHLFWSGMVFSAEIIVPVLAIIVMGWVMKRRGEMSVELVAGMSHIVYRYALPMLLFVSVVKSEVSPLSQWRLICAGWLAVAALYVFAARVSRAMPAADRGVFIQGVFRGNMGIIGLSLTAGVYGSSDWFAASAIFAGAIALQLNILAVICLSQDDNLSLWPLVRKVLHNPLVIALLLALLVKALHVPMPKIVITFASYYKNIALPLALLATGASFDLRGIFGAGQMAIWASVGRLLLSPMVFVVFGLLFGLRGQSLGILYLMGATPAASAGYVMAKVMGGNATAAANIIAITTAFSLVLVAPVIALFPLLGWA